MIMEVLIATKNEGKIKEFKKIFSALNIEVKSLLDIDSSIEIVENADSFEGNAVKKATEIANKFNVSVIADDSGLVVPLLNGEPGIYSARYAGEPKSDLRNNEKLINRIREKGIKFPASAHYYCAIALVSPNGTEVIVNAKCEGQIIEEKRGENGFGYDPIFYVPEFDKTMAELDMMTKNSISHRAKAIKKLFDIAFKGINNI